VDQSDRLNSVDVLLDLNAAARTFTSNAVTVLRYFDPRADRLDFGDTPYRTLRFTPHFVQYMVGFKFVYLQLAESDRSVSPVSQVVIDRR
jgi:hypothetical protein